MTRHKVVVFGSLNMDLVVQVPRAPMAGETLLGTGFLSNPGGKGANQAVACARQGGRVEMVGCVGDDAFGADLLQALRAQGVDAGGVAIRPKSSSGTAVILVDDAAENRIVVVPGANALATEDDALALGPRLADAGLLLLQLELPLAAVQRAAQVARAQGCPVLLNPAPAQSLPPALLSLVDILVVNETEAQALTGLPEVHAANALQAARLLASQGPREVILTLGSQGVVWHAPEGDGQLPAVSVRAVDTTAAGDTFIGAYAAMRVEGRNNREALAHAVGAAGLSVTRPGAQASMPTRAQVVAFLRGA